MNSQKIRELCARAMGWHLESETLGKNYIGNSYLDECNHFIIFISDYDPLKYGDQASLLLETVAKELGCKWSIWKPFNTIYECHIFGAQSLSVREYTENLAKILCALRASPEVTDAEIEEALK